MQRAGRAHTLDDGRLPSTALLPALTKTCADRDDRARPDRQRGVDRLLERGRRHSEHDELGRLGQRRECRSPEHLAATLVDEEHRAPMLASQSATSKPLTPRRLVVRRADHGYRAWLEQRPQVAHALSLREQRGEPDWTCPSSWAQDANAPRM